MANLPPPPPGFVPIETPSVPGGPPPGFVPIEQSIDRKTGAPARVRQAVGSAPTERDRLSTIRKYYPDAQPTGGDNFIYTDPKTQRPTLYNSPRLDFGDVVSMAPEIGEAAGGTLGGIAATLAQPVAAPITGGASLMAIPAAVGLGAAGGREIMQLMARGLVGTDDSRGLIERLTDTGVTGGMNAVGMRLGELGTRGVQSLVRGLTGSARAPGADVALRTARDIGVDLPPGAVTGSIATQRFEKGLASLPGATDIVQRAYKTASEQLGDAAARVGRLLTGGTQPLSKEGAGDVLQSAAKAAQVRFGEKQDELYNAAFDMIGRDTRVPVPRVQGLASEIEAELAKAPQARSSVLGPVIERAQAILADAENGVPFEALRAIRTDIGKIMKDPPNGMTGGSATQAQLSRLYGALTEDIGTAAKATSPEADKAMRLADRYTRFNVGTANGRVPNAEILRKVIESKAPEKALNWALSGAKDGGTRLQALRRNMRPEEWDAVSASVWNDLGKSRPGQAAFSVPTDAAEFSPQSFVTNYNNLSEEARNALFRSTSYSGMADDMVKIGKTAQRLNDSAKQANFSNSANVAAASYAIYSGLLGVASGDITGTAAGMAGGVILPRIAASKLMNNPGFVNWLARVPTQGGTQNIEQITGHIARLPAIAAAEPAIRDEIEQFHAALRDAPAIAGEKR